MDEGIKYVTNAKKVDMAIKIADLLNEEAGSDEDAKAFALKTAAGLIWGHDYQSLVKL